MKFIILTVLVLTLFGYGLTGKLSVKCPVPVSPPNGQVSLMKNGDLVKYTCNDGFKLLGSDIAVCKDDTWVPEPPTCIEEEDAVLDKETGIKNPTAVPTTERPLFKWDSNNLETTIATITDEEMQNDEARLHLLLYPDRRGVLTQVKPAPTETEAEKSGKSGDNVEKKDAVPSVIYVRRGGKPSLMAYRRSALHNPSEVTLITGSKEKENGEVAQSDERWRYLHWLAQAGYPYHLQSYVQSVNGHPVVMTLSESQIAWINSLYPEVRDKYLRDLYNTRAQEYNEEIRAQYLYGRYGDAYNYWYYNNPYYTRQPVSVVADPVSNFDYSCHQVDDTGRTTLIRAPLLPNGYVYRYDRRKNPNYPNNHYLVVEYRCNPGYVLHDSRLNEMYCSNKRWTGAFPICVPRD